MDMKIETHINIIPFGAIHYSSKGSVVRSELSNEIYKYQVPQTTNIDSLEFSIDDEVTLTMPSQEG
jgi:sortase (surface protein transpeptidase)